MNKYIKRLYDYLTQTLILFAYSVIIMMMLAAIFGDLARDISPLYKMGSKGLASSTMLEFLLSSAVIIALKEIFFSEQILKGLMTLWRTVLMLFSVLLVSIIFIASFKWFPLDFVQGWVGFLLCFGGSCLAISAFLIIKTKLEGKRFQELLNDYKKQHEDFDS